MKSKVNGVLAKFSIIYKKINSIGWYQYIFLKKRKQQKYYSVAITFGTACEEMKESLLEQLSP